MTYYKYLKTSKNMKIFNLDFGIFVFDNKYKNKYKNHNKY
jgi:hypothetical protein